MSKCNLTINIKVNGIMKTRKRAPRKELPLHEYERLKANEMKLAWANGMVEVQNAIHKEWMNRAKNKIDKLNKEKKIYMWLFFLSAASIVGMYVYELLK